MTAPLYETDEPFPRARAKKIYARERGVGDAIGGEDVRSMIAVHKGEPA
jgi:hypothetical protein